MLKPFYELTALSQYLAKPGRNNRFSKLNVNTSHGETVIKMPVNVCKKPIRKKCSKHYFKRSIQNL